MMMVDSADDATHLLHTSYLHDVTCTRQKSLLKGMRASSEREKEREERKPKPRATDELGAISSSASGPLPRSESGFYCTPSTVSAPRR